MSTRAESAPAARPGRRVIRIAGRETPVPADPGQTILEACTAARVPMPYTCRSGECAECRADLLAGEVEESPGADPAMFTDADRAQGRILTCLCRPLTDITIGIALGDGPAAPGIARVPARVARIQRACRSVVQVEVETAEPLAYRAGQYFDWHLPAIAPDRKFSAATRPGGRRLVFDVRLYPGGKVGHVVRHALAVGDTFEIIGPHGQFGFTGNAHRPAICVAGGTGLAPIKAMVDHDLAARTGRRITLFLGARGREDLYGLAELERWAGRHDGFDYHVALSAEPAASAWRGGRGPVTDLVAETVTDGFGLEAYLCGPPPMIDAALPILDALGVAPEDIHTDRFLAAKIDP